MLTTSLAASSTPSGRGLLLGGALSNYMYKATHPPILNEAHVLTTSLAASSTPSGRGLLLGGALSNYMYVKGNTSTISK